MLIMKYNVILIRCELERFYCTFTAINPVSFDVSFWLSMPHNLYKKHDCDV